jgi:hypothetical protein
MKKIPAFAVLRLCAFALILAGCACPHRKAVTTHTVEVFDPAARPDGLIAREECGEMTNDKFSLLSG